MRGPVCCKTGRREMKDLHAGFAAARWPRPASAAQVTIELERWREAATALDDPKTRAFAQALPESGEGAAILAALFGNSPYLSHCVLDNPAFAVDLLRRGPDAAIADVFSGLRAKFGGAVDEAALMSGLRCA